VQVLNLCPARLMSHAHLLASLLLLLLLLLLQTVHA
jgi:hypothetical protein